MTTTLTVGDTTPGLTGTVDASITGAEAVHAHIRRPDQTVIDKVLTVVDGPTGKWRLDAWAAGDLNASGYYELEVEVTFAGGAQQTFWAEPDDEVPVVFFVRDQIL